MPKSQNMKRDDVGLEPKVWLPGCGHFLLSRALTHMHTHLPKGLADKGPRTGTSGGADRGKKEGTPYGGRGDALLGRQALRKGVPCYSGNGASWEGPLTINLHPSPLLNTGDMTTLSHTHTVAPPTLPLTSCTPAAEGDPSHCCPSDVTGNLELMSHPEVLTDVTHTHVSS